MLLWRLRYFAVFVCFSILLTWPAVLHLADRFTGLDGDAYHYIWNIDTFVQNVLTLQNPFFTDRIFYPYGAFLFFHAYGPFASLGALLFFGQHVVYFNLLFLLSLAVSGYLTYLYARLLQLSRIPAICAGFLYMSSPIMYSFIWTQHYQFVYATVGFPLALILAHLLYISGKAHSLFISLLAFWALFFTEYYSGIMYVFVFGCYYVGLQINRFKHWSLRSIFAWISSQRRWLLITLLTMVISSSSLISALLYFRQFDLYSSSSGLNPVIPGCSANLAKLFIPNTFSGVLREPAQTMMSFFGLPENYDTPTYFTGYLLFIAAVAGLIVSIVKKQVAGLSLSLLAIGILLLSLGSEIRFGRQVLLSDPFTLYSVFGRLPLLSYIDCPQRFMIIFQLVISVGVALVIQRIFALTRARWQVVLVLFLFMISWFIEYGPWSMPHSSATVPLVYQQLAERSDSGSVLEMPSGITESKGAFGYDWSITALHTKQLYWQTVHDKPRIAGYLSRLPADYYGLYKNEPVLGGIFSLTSLDGELPQQDYTEQEISNFISKFNLGYVVLSPNQRQQEFALYIESLLGEYISSKDSAEGFILYTLKDQL